MKKISLTLLAFLMINISFGQKRYYTKTGNLSFRAGTAVEDIDGLNKSVTSIFDTNTGQIEFALLVKGFEFKSALMEEHFNENYMESDKYPKSVFKGKIINLEKINFLIGGTYPVTVRGTLEIHGVKEEVEATGTFKVDNGIITSTASFNVALADYNIAIPSLVKDKISKTAEIKVNCTYALLN